MNILFTCAGRRNYLINYFKEELEGKGLVFAADMQNSAPALTEADEAFILPSVDNGEVYLEKLLQLARKNQVNAIVSLYDLELPVLAKKKEVFENEGITVIVSDPSVINTCFDKLETIKFARQIGIKTPATVTDLTTAHLKIAEGSMSFPLVIKPRWGTASMGLEFVRNKKELENAFHLIHSRLDSTYLAGVSSSDRNNAILIQEKIKGTEYGLDIINDLSGNHIAVIPKKKLAMRAGETDKAVTVREPGLQKLGATIGKELGHIGNLDCDIFEFNGEYFLLEMNPRFGGGYPFSHESGVNLPGAIICWLSGEEAPAGYFEYQSDFAFAKCDRMIKVNTEKKKTVLKTKI